MTPKELKRILYKITYMEYVEELKSKYGKVPKDYFYVNRNGNLSKTQGIGRGKDGLYIHHVYECYFIDLSSIMGYELQLRTTKDRRLLDSQKAENLVYCNLIEHLILHMKIALEYKREQFEVGINFITTDLNRLYDLGDKHLIEKTYSANNFRWKQTVYQVIQDDWGIYVFLAKLCIKDLHMPKEKICSTLDGELNRYIYKKLYKSISKIR